MYQNLLLVGEEIIGEGHNLGAQQLGLVKVCIGEDLTRKIGSLPEWSPNLLASNWWTAFEVIIQA